MLSGFLVGWKYMLYFSATIRRLFKIGLDKLVGFVFYLFYRSNSKNGFAGMRYFI